MPSETLSPARRVHVVGSVPLADADSVFLTVSAVLGNAISRIPDGETGDRLGWIGWQHGKLAQQAWLRPQQADVAYYEEDKRALFEIVPGTPDEAIRVGNLGYADAALASYARFSALQRAGRLDAALRFQVSLPTPLAIAASYIAPSCQAAVEAAIEARMMEELQQILAAIPPDALAIQWDVAVEFAVLELGAPVAFDPPRDGIITRLRRLGNAVPPPVELGFHLCYGDLNHHHFKEPEDTATLVGIANDLVAGLDRGLDFLHMPVPRDRSDDAYFQPLAGLRLPPQTELYLGLVHYTDGVEGTRKRIATAARHRAAFGIATECGLGRRPPETVEPLLRIHLAALG